MDVTLNDGNPVKVARQPTNEHLHLTVTTAVKPLQICFTASVLCFFFKFYLLYFLQYFFSKACVLFFAADPKKQFLWAVARKFGPFSPTTFLGPYICQ